jgi:hypothetical protein
VDKYAPLSMDAQLYGECFLFEKIDGKNVYHHNYKGYEIIRTIEEGGIAVHVIVRSRETNAILLEFVDSPIDTGVFLRKINNVHLYMGLSRKFRLKGINTYNLVLLII